MHSTGNNCLELALGMPGGVWCIACLRHNAEAEPNVDEEPDLSQTRTAIGIHSDVIVFRFKILVPCSSAQGDSSFGENLVCNPTSNLA